MILGQIELGTPFGNLLYNICNTKPEVKTVVEIGTWHGMGSTKCLIQGLIDSGKADVSFISLEANPKMYAVAINCWKGILPYWAKLIHGRIVEMNELDVENLGSDHPDEANWLEEDTTAMMSCNNVLNELPAHIDFLFLDGGGFTTMAEFEKLKDRSAVIFIDDTNTRKGRKIRDIVFNDPETYQVVVDDINYRNGVMGFINKKAVKRQ